VLVVSGVVVWVAFDPLPHTGGDNAGYIALAHGLLTEGTYSDVFDPQRLPHTKYPPVFPLLLAGLIASGARSWVALKMVAAVSTVVAVAATYLWAERRLGPPVAVAVALLVSVSAAVVYYSHWILSDPTFVAFSMVSLYCLARAREETTDAEGQRAAVGATGWLVAGVATAGLAYFTRSAGLPLVVALLTWLALQRRWRALVASGVALGLPMVGWWLRGRAGGVAQYATEFWMVNPYDPSAGTIGPLGLPGRAVENLSAYVLRHGPAGVVGQGGPALTQLGIALALMAFAGWVLALRRGVGPAELFFPLYTGLILLWPPVWGGDRFALPLYPLVFVYSATAVAAATASWAVGARRAVATGLLLVVLVPAAAEWMDASERSSACAPIAREQGPWACYGPRIASFAAAAEWTVQGLPPGSSVLSRKPRHFYLLSGHPSRTFPFVGDPAVHLALADSLGARYVLLDQWDGLAGRHVGAAVRAMPAAFCYVRGFGPPEQGGAQLLGILPPGERSGSGPSTATVMACPAEFVTGVDAFPGYASGSIPLLSELDS
jgi:hypothetical protein